MIAEGPARGSVRLGLGLLSIGRTWGWRSVAPPIEDQVRELLTVALEAEIGFFDTAPAYAASESLTGAFLKARGISRSSVTLATKMGEYWDPASSATTISHSYDDLMRGLETSLNRLPWIDVLQVHKATPENVLRRDVLRAIEFAKSVGVKEFGASVSDLHTAEIVCRSGVYGYIQFPFNAENDAMRPAFGMASDNQMSVLVNRPFAMGKAIAPTDGSGGTQAFTHILKQDFSGFILTGTSSPTHLRQNIAAFRSAATACG
jgi:aryl-alcohol dehydrogenase-like predicted oxidoreductase